MEYKGFPFSRAGWQLHMMPAGYLMIEHRLIERMVRLMNEELIRERKRAKAGLGFLGEAVDFIRKYADQCHHGKEEDILFREMAKKRLDSRHRRRMNRLVREHKMGRNSVKRLVAAIAAYKEGKMPALRGIKKELKWLAEFYPQHIAKEDKGFFIPAMSYFNKEEQERMLLEFCRFDGPSIQKDYRLAIERMEKKYRS